MKFILNKVYGYASPSRVLAFSQMDDYFSRGKVDSLCKFLCSAIILTTSDFDLDSPHIQVCSDSDSVQYRPKAIYKGTKGFYYKLKSQVVYLTGAEVTEMNAFIKLAKEKYEN